MENSSIEWTHHTFNPWIGCAKVSPGCDHCYAENMMATRYGRVVWGKGQARSRTSEAYWKQPLRWNAEAEAAGRRDRVFCASLADILDEEVPVQWLIDVLQLILMTPHLDWLLLTKRDGNLRRIPATLRDLYGTDLLSNIWLGVTAELQPYWNRRVRRLMQVPAVVHFVSVEPMLGPVVMGDLRPEWVICGGESGHGARPMIGKWAFDLMRECQLADVPFFFKQWGGVNKKEAGRLLNGQFYNEIPMCKKVQKGAM